MTRDNHKEVAGSTEAEPAISVVMSVYRGTPPEQFRRALQSIYEQTYAPRELIVVEDGPLTPGHHAALDEFSDRDVPLRRVSLPTNRGRGVASQEGLLLASSPWVARADADDVCLSNRLELQARALRAGTVDVLGGSMLEFGPDEATPTALREMPLRHQDIVKLMRFNNPINNPTVVFRRSLALEAGGYHDTRMEDYDLWARMWACGARMANLSEPLAMFRADESMFLRRSSWQLTRAEWRIQRRLQACGLIGPLGVVRNLVLRLGFRALPQSLLSFGYRRVLTKPVAARSG